MLFNDMRNYAIEILLKLQQQYTINVQKGNDNGSNLQSANSFNSQHGSFNVDFYKVNWINCLKAFCERIRNSGSHVPIANPRDVTTRFDHSTDSSFSHKQR